MRSAHPGLFITYAAQLRIHYAPRERERKRKWIIRNTSKEKKKHTMLRPKKIIVRFFYVLLPCSILRLHANRCNVQHTTRVLMNLENGKVDQLAQKPPSKHRKMRILCVCDAFVKGQPHGNVGLVFFISLRLILGKIFIFLATLFVVLLWRMERSTNEIIIAYVHIWTSMHRAVTELLTTSAKECCKKRILTHILCGLCGAFTTVEIFEKLWWHKVRKTKAN